MCTDELKLDQAGILAPMLPTTAKSKVQSLLFAIKSASELAEGLRLDDMFVQLAYMQGDLTAILAQTHDDICDGKDCGPELNS